MLAVRRRCRRPMHPCRASAGEPPVAYSCRRCTSECNCLPVLAVGSARAPEPLDERIGQGVFGAPDDRGGMTTMNGRDVLGDQLELAPRIGLSEPLLRPE